VNEGRVYLCLVTKLAGTPTPQRLVGRKAVDQFIADSKAMDGVQSILIYELTERIERTVSWEQSDVLDEILKDAAPDQVRETPKDPAPDQSVLAS